MRRTDGPMVDKYQPGVRVSEYVLEKRVGAGSFGEVWQARHHVWKDDQVAIKLPIEPEYVRYLQREGIVVHGLRHANIVRVIGLDPYAEMPYLVMELVKGPSLREVLTDHPAGVPIETVLTVLRGVLSAMVAAHGANVLHRDLKPGNVLLHLDGKALASLAIEAVKVGDFGLGVGDPNMLQSIAQSASLARDDQLVGTLAYMAPELRDGKKKADPCSDLYSIGVMLFELLTGERPAGAELPSTIRADAPQALDEVFRRLYARYDRRYESAQAVLDDLESRLGKKPRGVSTPPPLPTALGQSSRSCDSCRRPVERGDQFCTHCGGQLVGRVRRCGECASYPGPHDRFCIFCGTALAAVRG